MDELTQLKILGQVAVAMFLGAAIGFERELADKPAGVRTHMLVAGAAALLVLLGDILVKHFERDFPPGLIRADPIRLVEAIVTGIGFLGAGTIIRNDRRTVVHGLTTAAALLVAAGVGICIALNATLLAVGTTAMVLLTLRLLHAVEIFFKKRAKRN